MFSRIPSNTIVSYLTEFKKVIRLMDETYTRAAAENGFICNGCQESCCKTRFYHYTYLEFYLLCDGLTTLPDNQYNNIIQLAAKVCRKADGIDDRKAPYRIMCPLNLKGRCCLYPFRPMICRMHGIAHELKRPDGTRILGEGCHLFEKTCKSTSPKRFNRTPFYRLVAELEKKLRKTAGLQTKIKMTIAEMILASINGQQTKICAP
jgi:Fe-S-cluster containining protein